MGALYFERQSQLDITHDHLNEIIQTSNINKSDDDDKINRDDI